MGKKDGGKPKGAMTSYACFVQACRDEHKKKHPTEQIVFSEFSKKCSERWKAMNAKEKKRFEDMAQKDKSRYEQEMADYVPPKGEATKRKKKDKDPNAPKRALSAFFFFCNEFRGDIKKANPSYSVGDIAKELGKRWEVCTDKDKYEGLASRDKERYERDIAAYKAGGGGGSSAGASVASKKPAAAKAPPKKAKVEKKSESEDDSIDDDIDDDDDEDDDDDDD